MDYKARIEKTLNGLTKARKFWEAESKKKGHDAYAGMISGMQQREELLRNLLDDSIWIDLKQIEYTPLKGE